LANDLQPGEKEATKGRFARGPKTRPGDLKKTPAREKGGRHSSEGTGKKNRNTPKAHLRTGEENISKKEEFFGSKDITSQGRKREQLHLYRGKKEFRRRYFSIKNHFSG